MTPMPPTSDTTLSAGLLRILAVAAGSAVANSYYNQAFLGLLAHDFGVASGTVATIPVLSQLGGACGVLFLAPLGDRFERRALILATVAALVVTLIAAALSPSLAWLAAASLGIGLFATVAQQIVPFAVQLSAPSERGRVIGTVLSGILIGVLGARAVSGVIADALGWHAVYWFAVALTGTVGLVLALVLPRIEPTTRLSYPHLLASMVTLVRSHAGLRRAMAIQFLMFGAFMGFWSTVALHLREPVYGLGGTAVGLLALAGIAGALAAPRAGALADRHGPARVVSAGTGLVIAAFLLFRLLDGSLAALAAGVLVMDLGVASSQVANQAQVHGLDPQARSRLNTVFMATMLLGGAFGAGMGGLAFQQAGWTGACLFGAGAAALALLLSRRG